MRKHILSNLALIVLLVSMLSACLGGVTTTQILTITQTQTTTPLSTMPPSTTTPTTTSIREELSSNEIINKVSPVVAYIESYSMIGTEIYNSVGTGIVVDERGYILTNNHVVEDKQGYSAEVILPAERQIEAEIVYDVTIVIEYEGKWEYIYKNSGGGGGSGNRTLEYNNITLPIYLTVNKMDGGSGTLSLKLLYNGEIVAQDIAGENDNQAYTIWRGPGFDEEEVIFPDLNLENLIRGQIQIISGEGIYPSDLQKLTFLFGPNKNISNISGLEYCTNLRSLDLPFNQITDISPLAGLENLSGISLQGNNISDISPLAGLKNLSGIWLHENNISNISPLSNLTEIRRLKLQNNQISDISPISGLTNLTDLYLANNQITDTSPLIGLTNLTHLYLADNQINDISSLSNLTKLTTLQLNDNQIKDISALAGLINLINPNLSNNQIEDVSPLIANSKFQKGGKITLLGNPLNEDSINIYIPQLLGWGVTVLYDFVPQTPTTSSTTVIGTTTSEPMTTTQSPSSITNTTTITSVPPTTTITNTAESTITESIAVVITTTTLTTTQQDHVAISTIWLIIAAFGVGGLLLSGLVFYMIRHRSN